MPDPSQGPGPNNEHAAQEPLRVDHILREGDERMLYVGWDWATESHAITVLDAHGGIVDRWRCAHTEAGLSATLERLARRGAAADLPVAIERADGLIVDRLLAAGHPVVPIHPNAFHAARPRWGAAKAKSDPGDSAKLADYLRTDGHRLRHLQPLAPAARQLQLLVRTRDDQVAAKVAATNQLAAVLATYWPGAKAIFADLASAIALDFLERYPTPAAAARLGEARLSAFLRRHSYCGRRPTPELLARLRAAPIASAVLDAEVLAECIQAQVRVLRTLLATLADLDHAIAAALPEHPQARLLAPLPRIGELNLAQVLAEVGPILDRAETVGQACAEAGAAPVTRASGKGSAVCFRWAVDTRARQALSIFADNSRHASVWASDLYRQARQRGKRHPHAIRILMRAWLRVLWACWHTGRAYDLSRHRAELRLRPLPA
jgi:Transposase/Transposase IS116/IS110/IS902 family